MQTQIGECAELLIWKNVISGNYVILSTSTIKNLTYQKMLQIYLQLIIHNENDMISSVRMFLYTTKFYISNTAVSLRRCKKGKYSVCIRFKAVDVLAISSTLLLIRQVVCYHHTNQLWQFRLLPSTVQLSVYLASYNTSTRHKPFTINQTW